MALDYHFRRFPCLECNLRALEAQSSFLDGYRLALIKAYLRWLAAESSLPIALDLGQVEAAAS